MSNDNETPENKDILKPQLSVIVPVYNEAGNMPIFFKELEGVLQSLEMDWEILFVDDGSFDNTWEIIETYMGNHRNFSSTEGLCQGASPVKKLWSSVCASGRIGKRQRRYFNYHGRGPAAPGQNDS
jgi:glycosyltransferase involved in cell wall biosynthesis